MIYHEISLPQPFGSRTSYCTLENNKPLYSLELNDDSCIMTIHREFTFDMMGHQADQVMPYFLNNKYLSY